MHSSGATNGWQPADSASSGRPNRNSAPRISPRRAASRPPRDGPAHVAERAASRERDPGTGRSASTLRGAKPRDGQSSPTPPTACSRRQFSPASAPSPQPTRRPASSAAAVPASPPAPSAPASNSSELPVVVAASSAPAARVERRGRPGPAGDRASGPRDRRPPAPGGRFAPSSRGEADRCRQLRRADGAARRPQHIEQLSTGPHSERRVSLLGAGDHHRRAVGHGHILSEERQVRLPHDHRAGRPASTRARWGHGRTTHRESRRTGRSTARQDARRALWAQRAAHTLPAPGRRAAPDVIALQGRLTSSPSTRARGRPACWFSAARCWGSSPATRLRAFPRRTQDLPHPEPAAQPARGRGLGRPAQRRRSPAGPCRHPLSTPGPRSRLSPVQTRVSRSRHAFRACRSRRPARPPPVRRADAGAAAGRAAPPAADFRRPGSRRRLRTRWRGGWRAAPCARPGRGHRHRRGRRSRSSPWPGQERWRWRRPWRWCGACRGCSASSSCICT